MINKEITKEQKRFPVDLSPYSYIEFNFYSPIGVEGITEAIKQTVNVVSQTITGKGEVSESLSKAANAGSSALNVITNEFSSRFSVDGEGNTELKTDSKDANVDKKRILDTIYMPLTNGITESMSNNYDTGPGMVASLLNKMDSATGVNEKLGQLASFTGSRALLTNPDVVQTYKSSGLRKAVFAWTLMPKNIDETDMILEIVRVFKMYSSPELQGYNALLLAPPFCQIYLSNEKLNDTLQYEEMMIESVEVSYGSSGAMETFHDGMPKEINLNVVMLERRMKTMDDWQLPSDTTRASLKATETKVEE